MLRLGTSADDAVLPTLRPDADDEQLVRRAQLGSSAAFEQLVLRHGPQLYRYLAVRARDDSDALDVLQETLVAAWQALPTLKQQSKFWPWIVGIAVHKSADAARRRPPTSDPEDDVRWHDDESVLEIREAVQALPEQFRQILLLRYILQLSEEEVAEALGIRLGTVKSRSARARKALTELLR